MRHVLPTDITAHTSQAKETYITALMLIACITEYIVLHKRYKHRLQNILQRTYVTRHTSYVMGHSLYISGHTLENILHMSYATGHRSLDIVGHANRHTQQDIRHRIHATEITLYDILYRI